MNHTIKQILLFVAGLLLSVASFAQLKASTDRSLLFVEEKGQNYNPDYLKFTWQGNQVFAYFCTDKVTFVTQEVRYEDNEESLEANRKGDYNKAKKLSAVTSSKAFTMVFENANADVKVSGTDEQKAVFDYYLGHCPQGILGAKTYKNILYTNIYPNIDLEFHIDGSMIKYNFIVRDGGNVADIKIGWKDVENLRIVDDEIKFNVGAFEFTDKSPVSECNGEKIATKYVLDGSTVGFDVEKYSSVSNLNIDPGITWSSFLEYNGYGTWGALRAVPKGAEFYYVDCEWNPNAQDVANYLASAENNYAPVAATTYNDVVISKFTSDGVLLWACRYGGSNTDDIDGAARVDSRGNLYVAGTTSSSNFPLQTLSGAYNRAYSSTGNNGFILRFKHTPGGAPVRDWATYVGGGTNLEFYDIDYNSNDDVYFVGKYSGNNYTEITSDIPYGSGYSNSVTANGQYKCFIMRFKSSGALSWSTFIPVANGNGSDYSFRLNDVSVDRTTDDVYFAGDDIFSSSGGLSSSIISRSIGSKNDVLFYFKFGSNNQPVPSYGNYYGGGSFDRTNVGSVNGDIEYDPVNKSLYIGGATASTDFPTTRPSDCEYMDDTRRPGGNSDYDGFILKIDATGVVTYSTFFGGDGGYVVVELKKDSDGNLWFTGEITGPNPPDQVTQPGYFNRAYTGSSSNIAFGQLTSTDHLNWLAYLQEGQWGGFDIYEPSATSIRLFWAGNTYREANVGGNYQYANSGIYSYSRAIVIDQERHGGFVPESVSPTVSGQCNITTVSVGGTLPAGSTWHWHLSSCTGTEITTGLSGTGNSTLNVASYPIGTEFYVKAQGTCLNSSCVRYIKPGLTANVTGNTGDLCQGETMTLNAGTGYASYSWTAGSGGSPIGTSATLPVTPQTTTTYTVSVTDANGCTATATSVVTVIICCEELESNPSFTTSETEVGNRTVHLEWEAIEHAARYVIRYGTQNGIGYEEVSTTQTSIDISQLTNDHQYFFQISAVGEDGYCITPFSSQSLLTPLCDE